jgi:hypothetical protein
MRVFFPMDEPPNNSQASHFSPFKIDPLIPQSRDP